MSIYPIGVYSIFMKENRPTRMSRRRLLKRGTVGTGGLLAAGVLPAWAAGDLTGLKGDTGSTFDLVVSESEHWVNGRRGRAILINNQLPAPLLRWREGERVTLKFVIGLGGVIMLVCLLLTIKAATPLIAVLLMAAILFGFQTAVGNIQTLPSDFYGSAVGQLAGFAGTAAKLAVVLLNFLIPVITVNSYAPAFAVGAGLAIMTVLSVLILCPRIEPLSGNK